MPDQESIASSAGGRELVRQRNGGQQQRFPDHAAYIRYLRGVNYVRTRNVAPPTPPAPSVTAPGAPTAVSATAGDAQATITFTPPTSNGGAAITGYTVTSNPDGITATGPTSPITVTGLTNGTAYTFTVIATNSVGPSQVSAPSNAVTPLGVPSAPTITSATRGNQQAIIAFNAPTDNGGSPITNYKYSINNGGTWVPRTPANTTSPLTIIGLTNGATYEIKLLAVNIVGDGTASNASSVTPATTPAAPTGLSATPASGQVTVAFTSGSDGGSPITNYEYSTDNGLSYTAFNPLTGAVSSVVITGLTNETTYNIKIRAVSDVGTGAASATITATPSLFTRTLFTTVGSDIWTVPPSVNSIEYLVVGAGGGGGGSWDTAGAGGGGGGEVITGTLSVTPGDTVNITVGAGGAGGTSSTVGGGRTATDGSDGLVSTLTYGATTITATGGGKGYFGGSNPSGGATGSGGIAPAGGNGSTGGDGGRRPGAGGGGGGAGGAGADGIQSSGTTKANGGIGLTSTVYSGTYGIGGTSGFGTNTQGPNYNFPGTAGANNTGNGGGGASVGVSSHAAGGAGGSGIVVIKYLA